MNDFIIDEENLAEFVFFGQFIFDFSDKTFFMHFS